MGLTGPEASSPSASCRCSLFSSGTNNAREKEERGTSENQHKTLAHGGEEERREEFVTAKHKY